MSQGYNYKSDNSVHALSRIQGIPEFEPNLDHFVAHSKAKLSDLLSVSVIRGGFLISKKLKEILEQFNLVSHKSYPAKVSYKKELYDYYWMHIASDFTNDVDYNNSSFIIYQNYAHNLGQIKISSKDDLIEKRKEIKADNPGKTITIWSDKINMADSFDKSLDMFEIGMFDANTYISSALKEAIINNRITGCYMTEASNLSVK
jgi:hypothetical protein